MPKQKTEVKNLFEIMITESFKINVYSGVDLCTHTHIQVNVKYFSIYNGTIQWLILLKDKDVSYKLL